LVALTRKDTPYRWTNDCENAFRCLKTAFTSAPILQHFDPDREIIVETDASDYVSGGILSQYDNEGRLHPVAFFSKKHSPAECNYEIYDKELMAIIRCFEEWRPELEGATHPIKVLSDHKNLEYFMTTKQLSRRHVRWAEFLSRFNFKISYQPGKLNGKADALTRRSGDLPKEGDKRLEYQGQILLKPKNLDPPLILNPLNLVENHANHEENHANHKENHANDDIDELFKIAYEKDPTPNKVLKQLRKGMRRSNILSLAECSENADGRLLFRNLLYVPNYMPLKLRIIQDHHNSPVAGHPERAKTLELIKRQY
jgi:hypothetical protein